MNYWTKERCMNDARKYRTTMEWIENSPETYLAAVKNMWLDECCKHAAIANFQRGFNKLVDEFIEEAGFIWKPMISLGLNVINLN